MKKLPHINSCIYCGSKDLSKEDIYPKWLGKGVIPMDIGKEHSFYQLHNPEALVSAPSYKYDAQGDLFRQKLRVVCKTCNNGWMSRLQGKAKPILAPLIRGDDVQLDRSQIEIVNSWIMMFTITRDCMDPVSWVVPEYERSKFRTNQRVPSNWNIWIGFYAGQESDRFNRHVSSSIVQQGELHHKANTQSTTAIIGKLFFHAFSTNSEQHYDPGYMTYLRFMSKIESLSWPHFPAVNEDIVFEVSEHLRKLTSSPGMRQNIAYFP